MSEEADPTPDDIARWRAAAKGGDGDAMCNLGLLCHQNGILHGTDSAEGWWVRGAQVGHTDAMMNLGLLRYEEDRILGPNSAESWWTDAALAGNNSVKGINRVVYDITSKPPSTIELE